MAGKKKNKGGLLGVIGVKTEKLPSADEAKTQKRQEQMVLAWNFLRHRIDFAIHEFYRSGEFAELEKYVERPALDAMKAYLSDLRSRGVYWHQPDRDVRTSPEPRVVPGSEELDRADRPVRFVIEERFQDYSVLLRMHENEWIPDSEAGGVERVIQATVNVYGRDFKVQSVIGVSAGPR